MSHERDDIMARFRELPRDISPRRDLLPGIQARASMETGDAAEGPPRSATRRRLLAAAVIFVCGILTGRAIPALGSRAVKTGENGASPSDFAAAVAVQRAGTAYVAALERALHDVRNSAVREQAQESAAATLTNVARQLGAQERSASTIITKF